MKAMREVLVAVLVPVVAGCASMATNPRLSEIRAPAQTSVDLLLGNTVSLDLSSKQVAALVKLKGELDGQVKPIREEMATVRDGPPGRQMLAPEEEDDDDPLPPAGPGPYPPRAGPRRWVGAVRNSGDVGLPRVPRSRHRSDELPPDYAERRAKLEALLKKYDEVDGAAYARAELMLTEGQKAAARKLLADRAEERASLPSN